MRYVVTLAYAALLALSAHTRGDTSRDLELVDGTQDSASLVAIDDQTITFGIPSSAGQNSSEDTVSQIELSNLLHWGAPVDAAVRPQVLLRQGSRLVAAPTWTREGSIQFTDDVFTLKQTLLDDATINRKAVKQIHFEAVREPVLFRSIVEESQATANPNTDHIWLTNGDALSGTLSSIRNGNLAMVVDDRSLDFELKDVVLVSLRGAQPTTAPRIAIGLSDGGVVLANSCQLDRKSNLVLNLPNGLTLRGKRAGAISLVQPLAGRVTYLADMQPINYRHTPYFDLTWNYGANTNLFGDALQCSGRRWLKGLAMHSAARLVYRLPKNAERLECQIALDDSAVGKSPARHAAPGGSVVFRVLLARDGKFTSVFESRIVRSGDAPRHVSVDIENGQALALVVDYADDGDTLDHANWLDARLVHARSTSEE